MRKTNSKPTKVLPVVAGLALAPAIVASAQDVWNRTGDAISLTDYKYEIALTPDSKKDLTYLLGVGKGKFIDPVVGTQNIIKYLQTKDTYHTPAQKKLLAARYQNILNELIKREQGSYYLASLDLLNKAVSNKVLEPVEDGLYSNGKWNIDEGIYMLISSPECGNWSYPAYLELKLKGKNLEARIIPCEPPVCAPEKKETEQAPKEYPLPSVPKEAPKTEAPKKETPKTETPKKAPVATAQAKDYRGVSLLAQLGTNLRYDVYSAGIGVRFNPFKELNLGFGGTLDLGLGLDKVVDSYTAPLSAGRSAYGTITDTNRCSIGFSAEAQLGPLIFGAGLDYDTWLSTTLEQIKDQYGDVVKSNTNSVPNRQVFAKVHGGFEVPFGDRFKARIVGGYNEKDGRYFRAGGVYTR